MNIKQNKNPNKEEIVNLFSNAFSSNSFPDAQGDGEFQYLEEWFDIEEMLLYKHGVVVEARNDNRELVGAAFVGKQNPITWPDGKKAELFILGVDQKYQGKGIGTQLLKHCEEIALEMDAESLILNANSDLPSDIKFYTKNGYTNIGKLENYYSNGHAVFFIKNLS